MTHCRHQEYPNAQTAIETRRLDSNLLTKRIRPGQCPCNRTIDPNCPRRVAVNTTRQLIDRLSVDPWLRSRFLRERNASVCGAGFESTLDSSSVTGKHWNPCPLFGEPPDEEHPDPDPLPRTQARQG